MQEQQQQQQKKSTDLICFYIFLLVQLFFITSTSFSMINGDPDKIGLPKDSDHKICGYDNKDFNYIYFTTPQSKFLFRTVCVKECPSSQQITKLQCSPNSLIKSCTVNPSVVNIGESVLAYNSQPYNSQICLPENEDYFQEGKSLLIPQIDQLFGFELQHYKWIIMAISLISLFFSLLILIFFEKYPTKILWFSFTSIIICLFVNCFFSSTIYYQTNDKTHSDILKLLSSPKQIYFGFMITWIIIIILIVIYAIKIKQKMNLLVSFLKVGGDFIKSNWTVLLIPSFGTLLVYGFTFFWIQQQLYQLSSVSQNDSKYPYDQTNFDTLSQFLIYFNLAIFLWILMFIIGLIECLVSGMVCDWYYQQGTKANSQKKSIASDLISNHLGSIALGSLLIGIFKPIKITLQITQICQSFYNKLMLAINKHCYVIMQINPNHFLECGIIVRDLISKEYDTYTQIGEMGQTFINIISLFFGFLCQTISFIVLQEQSFGILISLYCFILGYTISCLFMSIYGQSSEAIFMLYLYNKYRMDPEDNPQSTITLQLVLKQINENHIQ